MSALLLESGERDPALIYSGCVWHAFEGRRHAAEASLPVAWRSLLEARRKLHASDLEGARSELAQIASAEVPRGEREFLEGVLSFRRGERETPAHFLKAAEEYRRGGDLRRFLRSQTNARIAGASDEDYERGDLLALRQELKRSGFFDLYGNLLKAHGAVLLTQGKLASASEMLATAAESYEKAGFLEDIQVTASLRVIAACLQDDRESARRLAERLPTIAPGKAGLYVETARAYLHGTTPPRAPAGHPLAGLPAFARQERSRSITSRIVAELARGELSPDELITRIWGERALHPSYRSRLFSAIRQIRVKDLAQVQFDGERYRLR